ncbi:MAG: UDP-N-acetylenolpyruvoylglucosamine reductase, partial [Planctomycetota bacterium]
LDELVIVEAEFSLEEDDREQLTRRMQNQWIVKRSAQPTRERRTACLFKDALGMTAGEVIEQAGLRDLAVGGAALFDADPKFVVVNESASSDDVLRLMDTIRSQVEQQLGVELQGMLDIW